MSEREQLMKKAAALVASGWTRAEAADKVGVSLSTMYRWLNPEYAERCRVQSRKWKATQEGVCLECGAPTKYNGHGKTVADICLICNAREIGKATRVWTHDLVIERIQTWNRMYGAPPAVLDWNPWHAKLNGDHDRAERYLLGNWPSFTTPIHLFGSWNAAIVAAGFEPNAPTGAAKRWKGQPRKNAA